MSALGTSAESAGVGVQLCMSHPRHVLSASRLPHFTSTRASNDYKGSASDQWDIGRSSLFADALGLAPSKDSYWSSTKLQGPPKGACCGPGCGGCGGPSTGRRDIYVRLESALATLSTGPVAFSDRIGDEDVELIMKSCRMDGTLLQPSVALTAVDAVFHAMAFPEVTTGPNGVVMSTVANAGRHSLGIVLAAELTSAYQLPIGAIVKSDQSTCEYAVWESNSTRASDVQVLQKDQSLTLPISTKLTFTLHYASPIDSASGWALMGESSMGASGKWVPVSAARFCEIDSSDEDMQVGLVGSEGERVEVSFFNRKTQAVVVVACVIGISGETRVSATRQACTPQVHGNSTQDGRR